MRPNYSFAAVVIICFLDGFLKSAERDLSEYKKPENAIPISLKVLNPSKWVMTGQLGLLLDWKPDVGAVVSDVIEGSSAAKAGISRGDIVQKIGNRLVDNEETMRSTKMDLIAWEELSLQIKRKDVTVVKKLLVSPWSERVDGNFAITHGLELIPTPNGKGARIINVSPPATFAGLQKDDILLEVNGQKVQKNEGLYQLLERLKPGQNIDLVFEREGKNQKTILRLNGDKLLNNPQQWTDPTLPLFTKPVYKLAVVPLEFPDKKLNPKIKISDWDKCLFSEKEYNRENATGQKVEGSLYDYYQEVSYGQLRVRGKVFEPLQMSKNRMEYSEKENPKYFLQTEALAKIKGQEGLFDKFDGVFFIYAGDSPKGIKPSNPLWPHRSRHRMNGLVINYMSCPEGEELMFSLQTIAHEFGHMLGLPDLYEKPVDNKKPDWPVKEGLMQWCTMASGNRNQHQPFHLSSWCKIRLGWIKPTEVDPRTPQKIILEPSENDKNAFLKIPLNREGTEYFLLENRQRVGFDKELPGVGLLIWRVVDGRIRLEESHGLSSDKGPGLFKDQIPFPSKYNKNFTPHTTPSSSPVKQGGWPLHITQIERLPDGRILLQIGYEYY